MGTLAALVSYILGLVIPGKGGSPSLHLAWADILKVVKAGLMTGAAAAVAFTLSQMQLLDKTNPTVLVLVTILTAVLTGLQRFLTDTTK